MITEEQKQQLEAMFKFKIGDVVRLAHTPAEGTTKRLHVVERISQECPGGVQLHYRCRGFAADGNGAMDLVQYVETELVISEPFPVDGLWSMRREMDKFRQAVDAAKADTKPEAE